MKIIAVEEHFVTEQHQAHLRSRKDVPKREVIEEDGKRLEKDWWSPINYALIDPDRPNKTMDLGQGRLKDMDEAGIDMQILSLGTPGVEQFDAEEGRDIAKKVNNELAEVIKQNPKRFAGFAAIAPQDPEAAADELERAVVKLGFKGTMITGSIRGEYLDDEKYWAIFERAERLRVPIYIHPGVPPADMIKPYLVHPVLAMAMWGFSADAGLHAMRLIVSGVFDKYPDLKIILGHLGESIPYWLWRIDSRWPQVDKGGMSFSPFKQLKKKPSQYFKDNFYISTSGMFWHPVLQFVCMTVGSDRVLFATDYPAESTTGAVQSIMTAPISDHDKERIFHLNAEKLFKL